MKAGACCEAFQGPSLAPWVKKTLEESGVGVLGFLSKGRVAPPPGNLPTMGYNLTALSQDTCSA